MRLIYDKLKSDSVEFEKQLISVLLEYYTNKWVTVRYRDYNIPGSETVEYSSYLRQDVVDPGLYFIIPGAKMPLNFVVEDVVQFWIYAHASPTIIVTKPVMEKLGSEEEGFSS